MAQPTWVTPAGSLGVIPEGVFFKSPLQATAEGQDVFFQLIAGELPAGIQVTTNGFIEGVPKTRVSVQGVPEEVSRDVTSDFAIRAFTRRTVGNVTVIDRIADRTFSLTITGQDIPEFVTPAGSLGYFFDGSEASIQIEFSDPDPDDTVRVSVLAGSLPPGLTISRNGLISGVIEPLQGPPTDAPPGYDQTPKDIYPNDFGVRATSKNFQFTLEITDGKDSNIRTYEIFVYAKDSMSADTVDFTADNSILTADISTSRTPILLTPQGSLGLIRADNYFAFQFEAVDFDGDAIEYSISVGAGLGFDATLFDEDGIGFDRGAFSLPPGLQLDPETGFLYGYVPFLGTTDNTYQFGIRVRKRDQPAFVSDFYFFTLRIVGNIDTDITWLTPSDLGVINNGAVSTLAVEAVNIGGRTLQYRLVPGSDSRLPQGLTLQPSGVISGRVSFNTFALDGGTTTFDQNRDTRLQDAPTTFDLKFNFSVNAYAPQTEQLGYQVSSIVVIDGGSGYTSQPTITIGLPPAVLNATAASAGVAVIENGSIVSISVGNPGLGYDTPPTVTITGGGGTGASAVTQLTPTGVTNSVSVIKDFSVTVNRAFNTPYESLYIKAMPDQNDRNLIDQLIQNQDIIPENLVYRAEDPNFGVAQSVEYVHAYGITASSLLDYVQAMQLNHYWRSITLGDIKTAQALDAQGNVLYEVVYSEIIDDLVNQQGISVGKSVQLPYPVQSDSGVINIVYPNSLPNMRDQIIDQIGQISPALPLWMTSKQANGQILGFTPAWVIAYVTPGNSKRVAYNIRQEFGGSLNLVDFRVDRYELDRSQTYNWNPETDKWEPSPPSATTFDNNTTLFDGGSTAFVSPADRWVADDSRDKYLVFPKRTILG